MAVSLTGVCDALCNGLKIEIETGEMPGIGGIFETQIDCIGALIDGCLERGEIAGGQTSSINVASQGVNGQR